MGYAETKNKIHKKLALLSKSQQSEVLEFVDFLLSKEKQEKNKAPEFGCMKGTFKMKEGF